MDICTMIARDGKILPEFGWDDKRNGLLLIVRAAVHSSAVL